MKWEVGMRKGELNEVGSRNAEGGKSEFGSWKEKLRVMGFAVLIRYHNYQTMSLLIQSKNNGIFFKFGCLSIIINQLHQETEKLCQSNQ